MVICGYNKRETRNIKRFVLGMNQVEIEYRKREESRKQNDENEDGKIEQNLHDIDFLVSDPLGHFLSLLSSQTQFLLSHILFLSQTHTILIYLPSRKLIESVGPDHKTHLKE